MSTLLFVAMLLDSRKMLRPIIVAVRTVRTTAETVQATALEMHEQMAMVILDHIIVTMTPTIKMDHEPTSRHRHRLRIIKMEAQTLNHSQRVDIAIHNVRMAKLQTTKRISIIQTSNAKSYWPTRNQHYTQKRYPKEKKANKITTKFGFKNHLLKMGIDILVVSKKKKLEQYKDHYM